MQQSTGVGAQERVRRWQRLLAQGLSVARSTRPHVFYFWAMDDRSVLPATMVLMRDGFGRAVQDVEI